MAACPRCALARVDAPVAGRPARSCPRCSGPALTVPVFRDSVLKPVFRALQAAWSEGGSPSGLPSPGYGKALFRLAGQPAAACRPCQLLWFDAGERPTPLPSPRREPELTPRRCARWPRPTSAPTWSAARPASRPGGCAGGPAT